jgi:S1-C subfamily serine protease
MNHLDRVRRAAQTYDWAQVHEASEAFIKEVRATDEAGDERNAVAMLTALRALRRHGDLVSVADALAAAGVAQPLAGRSLALGLADQGSPATAGLLFERLAAEAGTAYDLSEAEGGVARSAKDQFLATTAPDRRARHLREAYQSYRRSYDRDPERHYWQGINAVALAARAAQERIALDGVDDPAEESLALATRVLRAVETTSEPGPWPIATACEAYVALGLDSEAIAAAQTFVSHPETDAFEVNALLRQFTRVWRLDPETRPGSVLLPLLRGGQLGHEGGVLTLASGQVAAEQERLEKVFGTDRWRNLEWYRTGLDRCQPVCRIETRVGRPLGTGFLLPRADLGLDGPGSVVVTNAHVIRDDARAKKARAVFDGLPVTSAIERRFNVNGLLWSSPEGELDTAILELVGDPPVVPAIPWADDLPPLDDPDITPRAYVIGHPFGLAQPQFALHDNRLLEYDDVHLRYRSPTEAGSSGSPVFDDEWYLIGLHHSGWWNVPRLSGEGAEDANEAISIFAIRAAIRER